MTERSEARIELFVAQPAGGPTGDALVDAVRAALPWGKTEPAPPGEVVASEDLGGPQSVSAHPPAPEFSVRCVPELFPAGDVVVVTLVGSDDDVRGAVRSLEAAGLQVSRGDQGFELHSDQGAGDWQDVCDDTQR